MPADGPHLGEMHGDTGTILIQEGQSRESLKDTLLHEVFHAIRYQQGREDGGKVEEDYVRSLATGLIGVLSDNPTFAKWLILK